MMKNVYKIDCKDFKIPKANSKIFQSKKRERSKKLIIPATSNLVQKSRTFQNSNSLSESLVNES